MTNLAITESVFANAWGYTTINLAVSELSTINVAVRLTKKIEKIIKQNEFVNKWYELGNVKIFLNTSSLLVLVEVRRDYSNMDKQTKDKITNYLKKNKCIYSKLHDAYVYAPYKS